MRSFLGTAKIDFFIQSSVLQELKDSGLKTQATLEFAKKYCEEIDDNGFKTDSTNTPSDLLLKFIGSNTNLSTFYLILKLQRTHRLLDILSLLKTQIFGSFFIEYLAYQQSISIASL